MEEWRKNLLKSNKKILELSKIEQKFRYIAWLERQEKYRRIIKRDCYGYKKMNEEEVFTLERELEEIQQSLRRVIFKDYRKKMKILGIGNAREDLPKKKTECLYMAFVCEGTFKYFLFNPDMMQYCSQERKINVMYHEMIHYWCNVMGVRETKHTNGKTYHNEAFKAATRANMGDCTYIDDTYGYNEARLTPEAMEKVKRDLIKNGSWKG